MKAIPNQIFRIDFSSMDYDEFVTKLTVADADQKVLESGSFRASASILLSERVGINRFSMNRKMFQQGVANKGFITFTLFDPKSLFRWRGHEMTEGMIGILWNREHMSVSGREFKGQPVSIEQNFFRTKCYVLGYPEVYDAVRLNEMIKVPGPCLSDFREKTNLLLDTRDIDNCRLKDLMENFLVESLIACLANKLEAKKIDEVQSGRFKRALDFIHGNLSNLTSISQVCESIEVPERSLRRWFQRKYQMSPKSYLNKMRLNEVRRSLKTSKSDSKIFQVASEFNYWHMGQFTKDYKELFNEFPSQTKRNQDRKLYYFNRLP